MAVKSSDHLQMRRQIEEWLRDQGWRKPIQDHLTRLGLATGLLRANYIRVRPPDTAIIGFTAGGDPADQTPPTHGYFALLPQERISQAVGHLDRRQNSSLARFKTVLPGAGVLICTLPADRRIRGACALVDTAVLKRSIDRACPQLAEQGWRVRARKSCSVVVKYKPERRLISLLDLSLAHATGDRRERRTLYGRAYGDAMAGTHIANAEMLAAILEESGSFRMATPAGFDGRMATAYHAELSGEPYGGLTGPGSFTAWRAAGSALAKLHNMPTPFSRRMDARAASLRLDSLIGALAFVDPTIEPEVRSLASSLKRSIPEATRLSPLHGDFHAGQLLWDGARPGLLDYDELASGDPAVDLATCLAHLEADEVRSSNGADCRPSGRALLDGYSGMGPKIISARSFRWFLAWSLLEVAISPFRNLEVDYAPRCRALVLRAERALGGESPWL